MAIAPKDNQERQLMLLMLNERLDVKYHYFYILSTIQDYLEIFRHPERKYNGFFQKSFCFRQASNIIPSHTWTGFQHIPFKHCSQIRIRSLILRLLLSIFSIPILKFPIQKSISSTYISRERERERESTYY